MVGFSIMYYKALDSSPDEAMVIMTEGVPWPIRVDTFACLDESN